MDKRNFLGVAAGAAAGALSLPLAARAAGEVREKGSPPLLTVVGAIGKGNRGPLDAVRDQMMGKQKIKFDKAHVFTFEQLTAMPVKTARATLEYDNKKHVLHGPALADVLAAAGVKGDSGKLAMRAVDGYSPTISMADAKKYGFMVATHLDGKPMALGGLGPLWAVYEPDAFPDMMAKPIDQRFANCPWALYFIDVQA
ncbi:MAG: molybdopterin-dependent oxidoreductase [Pseudomonadota bacterium]